MSRVFVTFVLLFAVYLKLATYTDRAELKREYPELEDEDIRQALASAAALEDDKVLPLPTTR